MNVGDQIFLPITVQEFPSETKKPECFCDEEEMEFLHSLELYKVLKFWHLAFFR